MIKNKFFKDKSLNFISFSEKYIEYLSTILKRLDKKKVERLEKYLEEARKKTKQFLLQEMVEQQQHQLLWQMI